MENKEKLKERIQNAKEELAAMEALLNSPVWQVENVYSGVHFQWVNGQHGMLIETQWNSNRYSIYGARGNPFIAFSNVQGLTIQEMVDYLNSYHCLKLPDLKTNFPADN